MNLLIDCTNLKTGGAIQVATSFINDLNKLKLEVSYYIVLTPQLSRNFVREKFSNFFNFVDLPKGVSNKYKIARFLKRLENELSIDKVFCVFGPKYYKSKVPAAVGFAYGHYIYGDSPFYKMISLKSKIRLFLMKLIHVYLFNKNSNVLIFETEDARTRYVQQKGYNKKTYVVSNTLNSIFSEKYRWKKYQFNGNADSASFKILCMGVNYPHKNFSIITDVIDSLLNENIEFQFYITTTKNEFNVGDEYNKYINYLGRVDIEKVPSLYEQIDIVLMPSLLEIFSATYIEAMYMEKPVIAADMGFARDLCGDAALYFNPTCGSDAADKILETYNNDDLRHNLVRRGKENIKRFGISMDRTKEYLKIIKEL